MVIRSRQLTGGRRAVFAVLVLAVFVGAGLSVSAQDASDSVAADRAMAGSDTTWLPGDSVAAYDVAAGKIDSLEPTFIPFGKGEKLVYAVQYGIVNAGEATLEIRNIAVIDGTPCYNIVSNARTNDVFSVFYKVRDRYVSLMDTTELYSLRYEKHLREGKYKNDRHIVFDQKELNAYYDDQVIPIAPRTQDVLSAMYYVRTLPLEVGHSVAIANHTDGRNYPLVVKVLAEERVKVEAGTFDCLVVEPFLRYPGIFKQKGRVKVWVTKDRYHIPVLVKSKIVIGEVSAVLKEFRLADKFRQ